MDTNTNIKMKTRSGIGTGKRMLAAAAAGISAMLMLCSCMGSVKDAEGGELIKKARSAYKELNSARVLMTNTDSGEVEQEFTFKYDEKDILTFSYKGKSEKNEYAQYNNGAELFTYENGELSYIQRGEEGFVLPEFTMMGALTAYITDITVKDFQPMGANFGILPPLPEKIRDKKERYAALSERALAYFDAL